MRLTLLAIGLFISALATCCDCKHPGKINDEQYNQYNLIFKGKVIKISAFNLTKIIYLKIDTIYNGSNSRKIIKIISPLQGAMCGITPKLGEVWLIFAYLSEGNFTTNLCTRTKRMNAKAWDYNDKELIDELEFLENKRKSSIFSR